MIALRRTATGWVVGEPEARLRDGEPGLELRKARYYGYIGDALRAASRRLAGAPEAPAPEVSQDRSAALESQISKVMSHLRTRGSITAAEAAFHYNIWRLAGRIYEIRQRHGHDSVQTVWECHKGGRHARYVWVG